MSKTKKNRKSMFFAEVGSDSRRPLQWLGVAVLGTMLGSCAMTSSVFDAGSEHNLSAREILSDPRIPGPQGSAKLGSTYTINGRSYKPIDDPHYHEEGAASWYGHPFHGRKTANGEVFDMNQLTAAHKLFPLPSYARVTNIENGRSVIVRVNDRGPFAHNRIIDLSKETARAIGMLEQGVANVRVRYLGRAESAKDAPGSMLHKALQVDKSPPRYAASHVPTEHDPYIQPGDRKAKKAQATESEPEVSGVAPSSAIELQSDEVVTSEDIGSVDGFEYATTLSGASAVSNEPDSSADVVEVKPRTSQKVQVEALEVVDTSDSVEVADTSDSAEVVDTSDSVTVAANPSSLSQDNKSEFFVQVGAFSEPVNALKVRNIVRELGDVEVAERQVSGKSPLYIVRVGPYTDRETAMHAIEQMREKVDSIRPYVTK